MTGLASKRHSIKIPVGRHKEEEEHSIRRRVQSKIYVRPALMSRSQEERQVLAAGGNSAKGAGAP